jgi:long-chain acyl-CoA synthetase
MAEVTPDQLPLQRIYHWEKARAAQVYLTQPVPGGSALHYTWADVVNQARHMAAYLKSRNFPPRSNIGILSKNCAHWLIADYAIWMAGHVSVPLYPTLTAESVRQILVHSEARALFVGKLDDWDKMKAGVPGAVHCIAMPLAPVTDFPKWDDIAASVEPLRDSPVRPGSELATIIYTSGTTGMPKGVMQSFGALAWAVHAVQKRVGSASDDRTLSYLPLSHIAERVALEMGSLKSGFQIFFAESLETFARDLQRARPTLFFSVPRLWVKFQQGVHAKMPKEKLERLLKVPLLGAYVRRKVLKGLGLDQCRRAFGGAAPMPPELLRWYQALGLGIIEVYGMTENCGVSHSTLPGQSQPGYVGVPYDGVESRLGPDNEVQTRSPATMLGYFKEPEKTREAITEDGWLRTGDKGQLDAQGSLRITGRVKDLFKTSKGKYVAPAPIEDKLVAHPKVEACCVAGANQAQPCGLIMLSAEARKESDDASRRAALEQSLAEHLSRVNAMLDAHEQMDFLAVVKDTWAVDNGFVTPTMKVKRNVIESTYGQQLEGWYAKRQPVVWQS